MQKKKRQLPGNSRKVPWQRIAVAGLLAGLILTLGELVLNSVLLGPEWEEVLIRMGLPPVTAGRSAIIFIGTMLSGSLLAVLTIAGIRMFRGSPLGTLAAALVFWFLVFGYTCSWLAATGVFPVRLMLVTAVWSLGETMLAALVAARVSRVHRKPRLSRDLPGISRLV